MSRSRLPLLLALLPASILSTALGQEADLLLHGGKVVTADKEFSIHEALAVRGDRILRVGTNEEVLKTKGAGTKLVDLAGKLVLPGLMDSHVHPTEASMTEFDHPIAPMETIQDVLDYVKARADLLEDGEWIVVEQVFITRLEERRYPSRAELDQVAPKNPVLFATGPDASLNSLALKLSGIDRDFKVTDGGPGHAEKDPVTGEPTGILRGATRYVKSERRGRKPTEEDRYRRLVELLKDYNSVGLTSIADRDAGKPAQELFEKIRNGGHLTIRVFLSRSIDAQEPVDKVVAAIREVAADPLFTKADPLLRIGGIKTYLDGGMLTGSAYLREPWGVSKIYSISDPNYRGLRFIPRERLVPMVRAAVESGLQFTAHSVGDGAVHALLEAYEEVQRTLPIAASRPCITHSNFMSREAVEMLPKLGVVVDIQPAWLYLDTGTLALQFGYDRLRYFQPLRSIFAAGAIAGGGSDHMQKIGSLRSVNPYNPFLGMWITVARRGKGYDRPLHPEEALNREQAVRFYTIQNAHVLRMEKDAGSLEEGKLADFIVIDRDILTCPLDELKDTQVLETFLGGKAVYQRT